MKQVILFSADPHHLAKNEVPEIKGGLTIVDQGAERSQNRVAMENRVKVYPEDNSVKVGGGDISKQELESNRVIPMNNQPPTTVKSVQRIEQPKLVRYSIQSFRQGGVMGG